MPALLAHILLIEDDPSISNLLEFVLQAEGYAVTACATPQQAMTLLDRGGFDLVITDGFSTAPEAVVASTADVVSKAGVTPVALFTAHVIDVASARAAGFRDLITKPFDLDTLVRQVKVLLGGVSRCDALDPPQGGATWQLTTERAYSEPARISRERSLQAAGG
jgi:DNA-binding response OmpR family regulator